MRPKLDAATTIIDACTLHAGALIWDSAGAITVTYVEWNQGAGTVRADVKGPDYRGSWYFDASDLVRVYL